MHAHWQWLTAMQEEEDDEEEGWEAMRGMEQEEEAVEEQQGERAEETVEDEEQGGEPASRLGCGVRGVGSGVCSGQEDEAGSSSLNGMNDTDS